MSFPKSIKYILDSNVFIQAHRLYYAFDIAPSFWNMLNDKFENKEIISIDKVYKELKIGKDTLSEWIENNIDNSCFHSTENEDVLKTYSEIISWASKCDFTLPAIAQFSQFEYADPWLIAFAKQHNLIVVTQEVYDANIKRNIPIPNVCKEFDVEYIDTIEFIRRIKFKM